MIIRYVGEVDTLVRSYGKKVPVKSGELVEVSKEEAESLRRGGYKKYFASDREGLVCEVTPAEGEQVVSGFEGTESTKTQESDAPVMPTKREMYASLESLKIEITPEIKKLNSETLAEFLENARKDAVSSGDAPEAPASTENAPTDEKTGSEGQDQKIEA